MRPCGDQHNMYIEIQYDDDDDNIHTTGDNKPCERKHVTSN